MKLSIAWIFDHINADWKAVDIPALVTQCIQTTAEIEGFYPVNINLSEFSLAQVKHKTATSVTVFSLEWGREFAMPYRADAHVESLYLIKKLDEAAIWASMKDFNSAKEHLLPACACDDEQVAGGWKKDIELDDYILELDNKSITHRPDMWGHRGIAREIAAILQVPFKPIDQFIIPKKIEEYATQAPASATHPYALRIMAPQACKRFAGLYIENVAYQPSSLWMALRLSRVDSRPIDVIVDSTNYVMLDIGQPMHAFDAAAISSKIVEPRFAHAQEKLTLLDGSTIALTPQDLVITDGTKPLALAGVMGGAESGVRSTTRSLFIEAACFDATTIRMSAARHKIRTEASARFEKSLDPHQITYAIMRFLKIIEDEGFVVRSADALQVCGKDSVAPTITVSHDFIERRLGVPLQEDFVIGVLHALEFGVVEAGAGIYTITIPTFRATKDIAIKEDIVEEIGRYAGYTKMERSMPVKQVQICDVQPIMQVRTIKKVMASTMQMRELYNYALYDEEFLRVLQWDPGSILAVQSPVSEHWRRPVTSLVPHLFKAIMLNSADYNQLRFFEWARTWHQTGDAVVEKKRLAAIIFDSKKTVDFYACKALVQQLFDALHLKDVVWRKVDAPQEPWFRPYQTADLLYNNTIIGRVGMVNQLFLHTIVEGDAFIVELDGDFLMHYKPALHTFVPLSKYPEVIRDISILIAHDKTAHDVACCIKNTDMRIIRVDLVDFFEKDTWIDQRALTFRLTIQDAHKTLLKEEVEVLVEQVVNRLHVMGATIR